MGVVISITKEHKKRQKNMQLLGGYKEKKMYERLIGELSNNEERNYSINYAERVADDILIAGNRANIVGDIPIVKIVEEFGFNPYIVKNLQDNVSGNIYIGGTTQEIYGKDRVIVVGKEEEYFHQRFIIAHELGHYLFDYLGNDEYKDGNILFSKAYLKNDHDDETERRADRFAAELLMPAKIFLVEFIKAMNASGNDEGFVVQYLSKYFKTKTSSIKRRIGELGLPF